MNGETRKIKAKRASRITRPTSPPYFKIQKRDIDVLLSINRYRLLSQSQIQLLHFPSKNTAQVRFQHLWQHGFLRRLFSGGFLTSEALYTLDTKGKQLLQIQNGIEGKDIRIYKGTTINPLTIDHTLSLTSIRICADLSAKDTHFTVSKWMDDIETKADFDRIEIDQKLIPIVPDAYFEIEANGQTFRFFLEYDNGTEPLKTIQRKMRAYQLYLQTGKVERRYKSTKIRILFLVKPNRIERLQNFQKLAAALPFSAYFWFSDTETIKQNFFISPAWLSGKSATLQGLISSP